MGTKMCLPEIIQQATEFIEKKYKPDFEIPDARHKAFVNSMVYAVAGFSPGHGVQAVKERKAAQMIYKAGKPGTISFKKALQICEEACFRR